MLSHQEFWNRVKALEGRTIQSLTTGRRNTITRVTEKGVFTAHRDTPVPFNGDWGIYENYDILHKDNRLYIGTRDGVGNGQGNYLTMAIILAAVPDEAEKAELGIKEIGKTTMLVATLCKCGCNEPAALGSDYIVGHDSKHRSILIERAGGMDGFEHILDLIDSYMSGEYSESELAAGIRQLRTK
jgi:hypothetical protein